MEVFGLGVRIKEEGAATVEASLAKLGKQFAATTLSVTGITLALRKLVQTSDTMLLLEGRLGLVAGSTDNLRHLQEQLFESAQRTRSSYESISELYARVARNSDELGYSQETLLKFTELTQMSIRTSGINAIEASRGMIQLSQALASGVLRGDEFRAVMEQMPGTARAVANGLGVSVGALRAMAMEGELTAEKVINAVLKMEGSIREDFGKLPITIGDGMTRVGNAFSKAVLDANKMTGAVGTLGFALSSFAKNNQEAFRAFMITIGELGNVLTRAAVFIVSTVSNIGLALLRIATAIGAAITTFISAPLTLLPVVGEKIAKWVDRLNAKVSENDLAYRRMQDGLKDWRAIVMGAETSTLSFASSAKGAINLFGNAAEEETEKLRKLTEEALRYNALVLGAIEERRQARFGKMQSTVGMAMEGIESPFDIGLTERMGLENAPDIVKRDMEMLRSLISSQMVFLGSDLARMSAPIDQALISALEIENIKGTLADGIADSIEGGLMSGLEMGLASGNIGEAFRAMGQAIVSSMAKAMVNVAIQAIKLGTLLEKVRTFMIANPAVAVASAIALLTLAQSLGGGAQGSAMSGVGGRSGVTYTATSPSVPSPIVFGGTSATTAAGMTPRQATNITIIGPNDPSAQRAIQELMNKANSRGRIG